MNIVAQELLKEARKKAGLKQSDVAEKLGVKGGTISNWELGKADPDIDSFVAFCEICGADPIEVMNKAYGKPNKHLLELGFTEDEIDMIQKFRCLDKRGQRNVLRTLNAEYEDVDKNLAEDLSSAGGVG